MLGAEESEQQRLPTHACDIAVLLETRSNRAAARLRSLLPDYTVFTTAVQNEGLKGQGVAVLVRNSIADFVQPLVCVGDSLQALWFKIRGQVFGVQGHVLFGGAYIPPRTGAQGEQELEGLYEQLSNRVHAHLGQSCTHACIVGDFNAHLGTRSEFNYEHYALQARFPELGSTRLSTHAGNTAGRLLLDVCATAPGALILTTGRGRGGDIAQPTCRGATRTEHILLSPDLYASLHHVASLSRVVESDHSPLQFSLSLQNEGNPCTAPAQRHTCDATCDRMHHSMFRLRWKQDDPAARARYAALLEADQEGVARLRGALQGEGMQNPSPQLCVDAACAVLMGMIHSAALDSGLATSWRCPLRRRGRDVKHQAWFDEQCKAAKRSYLHAVWSGQARHLRSALKKDLQRLARRSKRSFVMARHFLSLLSTHHPKAFEIAKQTERTPRTATAMPMSVLEAFGKSHFGHADHAPAPAPAPPPAPAPAPSHTHPPATTSARIQGFMQRAQHAVRAQVQVVRSAVSNVVALTRDRAPRMLAMHFGQGRREGLAPNPAPAQHTPASPAPVVEPPHPSPDVGTMSCWVGQALARMKADTAAGLDDVPAAFIKHARVRDGREWRHVLAPLLSELFVVCMRDGVLPAAWKVARISPLYKKGPLLQPTSYRMLAVSSVLYRIYANALRTPVTDWCVAESKVPPEQFGFYPGRDTAQPCFILRHVCHAAKWARRQGQRHGHEVYAAFMDFTQAYDRVDRQKLWQHLEGTGMPHWMLGAVKAMYAQDAYMFVDGERRSGLIRPTMGVKQGCPLSPLLFSLYINDLGPMLSSPSYGARMFSSGPGPARRVTHLFYADDLVLLAESALDLQHMLNSLGMYSWVKGLTVNTAKSKVVVFNSEFGGTPASDPLLHYNGERLGVEPHFKYLGLQFNRNLKMCTMQEPWARALLGSSMRARRIAYKLGVHKDVAAGLRLFQSFAFPSGMYGCQVWGTRFAHIDRVFQSSVSVRQLCALRRLLGAARSSVRWAVLAELGAKPFHYYWVKALVRFQEAILQSNSPLLADVAKADAAFAGFAGPGGGRTCEACWSAELARALESIGSASGLGDQGRSWADKVKQGLPLGCRAAVLDATLAAYDKLAWQECVGAQGLVRTELLPEGRSLRKTLTYYAYFKPSQPGQMASYLKLDHELHKQITQLARFRLGCHKLQVELGRHCRPRQAWPARICSRCSAAHRSTLSCAVDDEYHMIFECERFQALRIDDFTPGTRRFTPGTRTALSRAQGSVRTFMESDPRIVLHFISRCMDILDADSHSHGT